MVWTLAVALYCVNLAGNAAAHPTVAVGANVPAERRISVERIDHSTWNELLKKYVDANGMVDYKSWKASAGDSQSLDAYLTHLSAAAIDRNSTRESQLAFWINAYNAVTVKGILREYPTTSIRNHTAKVYGYNIWKDLQLSVGGQAYSLDAIEHQVLRKMGEPRIHFAIVCASKGCPRLLNEAYVPERLDEQLTLNARAFFADPTKLSADVRSGVIQVSPILKWFAEDFGTDAATQLATIAPYLPTNVRPVAESGRARVNYLDYDWGLNDRPAPAQRR
jgi:hypothetical protein